MSICSCRVQVCSPRSVKVPSPSSLLGCCRSTSSYVFLSVWFPQYIHAAVCSGTFHHSFTLCDQSSTALFYVLSRLCSAWYSTLFMSLSETRRILRSTDISNTYSFLLCSSFNVHISALYRRMDCTKVRQSARHVCLSVKQEIWANVWDAPQHQFNFVRRLSWSISSIFQRKFTLSVRRSLK